jgi:hypothetical protein
LPLCSEDEAQIQIRFVNAAPGATGGFSEDGFSLFQSARDREHPTEKNAPVCLARSTCDGLSEPGLRTVKLALLLVEVAKMSLNNVAPLRWAESKCTAQSSKGLVVTSHRVNGRGELEPGTATVGEISD